MNSKNPISVDIESSPIVIKDTEEGFSWQVPSNLFSQPLKQLKKEKVESLQRKTAFAAHIAGFFVQHARPFVDQVNLFKDSSNYAQYFINYFLCSPQSSKQIELEKIVESALALGQLPNQEKLLFHFASYLACRHLKMKTADQQAKRPSETLSSILEYYESIDLLPNPFWANLFSLADYFEDDLFLKNCLFYLENSELCEDDESVENDEPEYTLLLKGIIPMMTDSSCKRLCSLLFKKEPLLIQELREPLQKKLGLSAFNQLLIELFEMHAKESSLYATSGPGYFINLIELSLSFETLPLFSLLVNEKILSNYKVSKDFIECLLPNISEELYPHLIDLSLLSDPKFLEEQVLDRQSPLQKLLSSQMPGILSSFSRNVSSDFFSKKWKSDLEYVKSLFHLLIHFKNEDCFDKLWKSGDNLVKAIEITSLRSVIAKSVRKDWPEKTLPALFSPLINSKKAQSRQSSCGQFLEVPKASLRPQIRPTQNTKSSQPSHGQFPRVGPNFYRQAPVSKTATSICTATDVSRQTAVSTATTVAPNDPNSLKSRFRKPANSRTDISNLIQIQNKPFSNQEFMAFWKPQDRLEP